MGKEKNLLYIGTGIDLDLNEEHINSILKGKKIPTTNMYSTDQKYLKSLLKTFFVDAVKKKYGCEFNYNKGKFI